MFSATQGLLFVSLLLHVFPYDREMRVVAQQKQLVIVFHAHVQNPWEAKVYRKTVDLNQDGVFQEEEVKELSRLVAKIFLSSLTLYRPKPFFFTPENLSRAVCEPLDSPGSEFPFECTFVFQLRRSQFPYGFARLASAVRLDMPLYVGRKKLYLFRRARNFFLP